MDQAQPPDQDLIAQVRRFNRYYTALLGLLRTHYLGNPVSFVEARVLFDVDRLADCRAVDLARSLGLDRGYLSRLLKGLEGKGLIKKKPRPPGPPLPAAGPDPAGPNHPEPAQPPVGRVRVPATGRAEPGGTGGAGPGHEPHLPASGTRPQRAGLA